MKGKIEAAANVIVILFAMVVGSFFLKDRLSAVAPESDAVKAGDKVASLDGWDWGAHDQTLVLVLRKGCHFCEDSTPFYHRLIAQQQGGSNSAIVAVFPDTADTVKEVVQSERLGVHALAGVPLDRLKVDATPTLLLVDRSGTVLNAWIGMLSPREELEVMRATTAPTASGLKSPGQIEEMLKLARNVYFDEGVEERLTTVLIVRTRPKSRRQSEHSQKEESDVCIAQFAELGGVGDTHSGGSQPEPSPDSGTIVLPTCGDSLYLQAAMLQQLVLWGFLLLGYPRPFMYERAAVLHQDMRGGPLQLSPVERAERPAVQGMGRGNVGPPFPVGRCR